MLSNWGKFANRISRDLVDLDHVSVKWVSRKENKAAHDLVRFAFIEPNRTRSNSYLQCILSHIPSDMEGVT
jgi:hypothetical protein